MRMTKAEFEEFRKRRSRIIKNNKVLKKTKGMNKTEARYANLLNLRKKAGEILEYRYESITLRLADNTRYTPDFMVTRAYTCDVDTVEFHEVKGGFIREDAWIKLKVAAEKYPEFTFYLAQYKGGQWNIKKL